MQVLEPSRDVQHDAQLLCDPDWLHVDDQPRETDKCTYDAIERRRWHVPDIIKEVTVGAQLADDHNRRHARVFRYADTKLSGHAIYERQL